MSPNLVLIGTLVKFATSTPWAINYDHLIDFFFFLNWFWGDRWPVHIAVDYNNKGISYHETNDKSTIAFKIWVNFTLFYWNKQTLSVVDHQNKNNTKIISQKSQNRQIVWAHIQSKIVIFIHFIMIE